MYIHLCSARVFPSDATQIPSLATPLPLRFKPRFGLKVQLGAFFFCYCFRALEAEREEVGSPERGRCRRGGWGGRSCPVGEPLLQPVGPSVADRVTLPRSGPTSR